MFRGLKYINKPLHIQYKFNKGFFIKTKSVINNEWTQLYKHLKHVKKENKFVKHNAFKT